MPIGVIGMRCPFPGCEIQIVAADRFVRAACPEELLTQSLVGETITPFEILRPDHVRHVVAHHAQHAGQRAGTGLALAQRCFDALPLVHFVAQAHVGFNRLGRPTRIR